MALSLAIVACSGGARNGFVADFELDWTVGGDLRILSSPRVADLNSDGILDVVIGHGNENVPKAGFVTAHDGASGTQLWRVDTRDEIFGSPGLGQLTTDAIPDVVIGGRNAELYAIDGATGDVLWTFNPQGNARSEGWYNFYTPQFLDDIDGDGVDDLLVANGGDSTLPAFFPRPPGHLMVLSGRSGAIIAAGQTPDGGETYLSALKYQRSSDETQLVVFGSGGETHAGSLWVAELSDVARGDLAAARQVIAPLSDRGMVAPPSLSDVTGDGTADIIAATFDGRLMAIDGETFGVLWSLDFANAETWASPALGFFDEDAVPDVFAAFSVGRLPDYTESILVAVSGATGDLLWRESFEQPLLSSPLAVDLSGNGRDEIIITLSPVLEGEQVVLQIDPDGWHVTELLRRPARSFGTGLITDLDDDGHLELITTGFADDVWFLERRALGVPVPSRISWGAYLGSTYNGRLE